MRVRLTFTAVSSRTLLPLNYQHSLASLIYSGLAHSSKEFASALHDVGYESAGKTFRLFTFSRLQTVKAQREGEALILENPEVSFQVSSPLEQFTEHLVTGLHRRQDALIGVSSFRFKGAELIPSPVFSERMAFRALSPITEATESAGAHARFLTLEDDWSEIIQRNLLRKFEVLYRRQPEDQRIVWNWNRAYIAGAQSRGKKLSVLVDIHGTKIRGWLLPFAVEGSVDLIRLGYEAGFGARNSMGFGMCEL
ncbi:MAG: CRISPR-associated endoribonuclease Cas6 [Pyrinomonadaceae bacterium]